jgi:hypothetical protein
LSQPPLAPRRRAAHRIGRCLAAFLAELNAPHKKNWIETKLTLRHEDGDDRWGWGVRFHVRSSDGLLLADSFECVGAG